jgi:tagatose-6-phosphate ketose/aldose isomerase
MNTILGYPETDLKAKNAYWTAYEIAQQPVVWKKLEKCISEKRNEIDEWLSKPLSDPHCRIILTGAGTSAYIGESIAPYLSKKLSKPVEAISTTNIVAAPDEYLFKERTTLIISYARSGNSPESVATCKLCDQLVKNVFHLIITCNKDGELAHMDNSRGNRYVLLMPEETNDKSFAMTSSFTSMLLTTSCVFKLEKDIYSKSISLSEKILSADYLKKINLISHKQFNRVVFLGKGGLLGIAREAALKMLELNNGDIDCYFESPLGFRHGPKLIINNNTLIVILRSSNEYSQKYDKDLIAEILADKKTDQIIDLMQFLKCSETDTDDLWLTLPYILFCQILAFNKSLCLNHTPDNPCPTGEANRVVQGVKIYPFYEQGKQNA